MYISSTISRFIISMASCLNDLYSFSRLLSHVQLFVTSWTVAHQAPLSMGFSRQEHWSGLPFPSPGDLPNPGIEPRYPALQAGSFPSESSEKPSIMKMPFRFHRTCGFDPWVGKTPWRRKWQPTPVLLPGKSHRQRSLVEYSP